jgi:hypothetical protein
MKKFFILALLALALVSCSPDPRMQADADATRLKSEQDAADQEQARAQDADRFAIEQDERQATSDAWVEAYNSFVTVGMAFFNLFIAVSLLGLSIGTVIALVGVGRAAANAAWVRSNIIGLDPVTRQYPLFLQRVDKGIYTLTDMNTGQVRRLDIRDNGDRQMIAAANALRLAGTVAHAARLSDDAAGVAMVGTNPVVVLDGGMDGQ